MLLQDVAGPCGLAQPIYIRVMGPARASGDVAWSERHERQSEPFVRHDRPTVIKSVPIVLALTQLGIGCEADDRAANVSEPNSSPADVTPASTSGLGSGAEQTPPVAPETISDVLGAAAAHRLFVDNSFGGQDVFNRVNVIDSFATPDSAGFLTPAPDSPLLDNERAAIEAALEPVAVTWVPSLQAVIGTDTTSIGTGLPNYEEVGAVLTLGRPEIDDGIAEVTSNLWCGGTCGIGGTHVLEQRARDVWSVTGTTGQQWIS